MQDNQREAVLYSYIAGIMDGEGTIRINKCVPKPTSKGNYINPRYSGAISIGMADKDCIQLLFDTFKSGYMYEERVPFGRKPIFRWATAGKFKVIYCLEKLLPYLRVKKQQALLVIQYCKEAKPPYKRNLGLSQKELQWREDLFLKVKKLNATGAPATTKSKDTRESEAIV